MSSLKTSSVLHSPCLPMRPSLHLQAPHSNVPFPL
uniref:Uncharacterized protein n=1 Tax=Anguilla anguilla TaxID=7936 RepID=A0A0E9Q5R8_ANGAN